MAHIKTVCPRCGEEFNVVIPSVLKGALKKLKVGDKVHYQPEHYGTDRWENGIVKEIRPGGSIFIVYNCAGNWDRYQDYTGCSTHPRDLKVGWKILQKD